LRAVNVYVVVGSDGLVVVDSGWPIPESKDLLRAGLREIGADFTDLRRFLVTHVHRDHYSQAVHLRREFGIRVTLGEHERASLEAAVRPGHPDMRESVTLLRELGANDLADLLARHEPKIDPEDWELPDDWFGSNDVVDIGNRVLDVVPTPGHTQGHVVFHDTAGELLFAGDHVLPTITPSIGFEPARTDNPLRAFLDSLAVVRARPDAMLLPAHGAVTASVHDRVDELVDHHRRRLDAMAAVLGWGTDTAAGVAAQVTWTKRERRFDELDMFNQFMAVCETGAHLELLVSQGLASRRLVDGIRRYKLVG
jgi:glyoxylase-like metal-dependent hydrolase (beta-lactamase superfamily II)